MKLESSDKDSDIYLYILWLCFGLRMTDKEQFALVAGV